ncbi:MAG: universal stress protein [Aldersonia sp.]|nr:universal stress protein [Aldersonia sp.]
MVANEPIVVGVDGSEGSAVAVGWAARTAAHRKLPLRIVAIVHVPAAFYAEPYIADQHRDALVRAGRERIETAAVAARQAAADLGEIDVTGEVYEGKATQRLVEQSESAWMIALGARGHGEISAMAVGSTASSVAAHAACPVVVVRGRLHEGLPPTSGPIAVGVDGSPLSQAAVEFAFEAASARGAPLTAVHVWSDVRMPALIGGGSDEGHWKTVQEREEGVLVERLAEFVERFPDVEVARVVARDRPVRVLSELSERAQLIVVGSRGRGGFTGMLMGSTSNALMHTADCPVVVVRPRKQK